MKGRRERDQAVAVAGGRWGGGWGRICLTWRGFVNKSGIKILLSLFMIYIPSHFTSLSTK